MKRFLKKSSHILIALMLIVMCVTAMASDVKFVYFKDSAVKVVDEDLDAIVAKSKLTESAASDFEKNASAIIEAIVAGPSDKLKVEGFTGLLPVEAELVAIEFDGSRMIIKLALSREFLDNLDELYAEDLQGYFAASLRALEEDFSFQILVRYLDDPDSEFKPFREYLPQAAPGGQKPEPKDNASTEAGSTPFRGQGQPSGELSGKSIFVSAGHGWYYSSSNTRWQTQRFNASDLGIVEDFSNAEAVDNWLTKYLWNAGAGVYTTRERDMNTNMVIVDNGGSGHSETGSWTTESSTSAYGGTQRRSTTVTGSATATSRFTPSIPADGFYGVYVWYRPPVSGTTVTDAEIIINHTGGSTTWNQNQGRDGYTWKYVGTYYFDAGSSSANGSVVVTNKSAAAGSAVVADAVRFGGGMGDVNDTTTGAPSGKSRWEESGKYYARYMGATIAEVGDSTVSTMPKYAAWESESWEDSVYISWHTNAGGATGTSSFAYSSGGWDGAFDGVTGSVQLRNLVHAELMNDLDTGWLSGWQDVGLHTGDYGEINPVNNNEMPGCIYEMAFHDDVTGTNAIKDPRFRQICARAVYQGIVKYFADAAGNANGVIDGGESYTLLPETPTHFRAALNASNNIVVSWSAPPYNSGNDYYGDAATGYKVYMSTNGKGFDNGAATASTSYTINGAGLVDGQTYYLRVSATNAGGESFPTETLAVRYQSSDTNPILIVNGFDRLDRWMMIGESDVFYPAYTTYREYLDRMNSYDYVIQHAEAIVADNKYFDSASNEAVESGVISLSGYEAVIWICGEESSADDTFSGTEQTRVQTYLDGGGQLFVSGAEIGYELVDQGAGASFYQNYLKAGYAGDGAGTYTAQGSAGIFASVGSLTFDDGSQIYDVNWPDQLSANGGSTVNMTYTGGSGGNAAIQYSGTFKVVNMGFPFETITSATQRNAVMAGVLGYFTFGTDIDQWELY